MLVERPHVSPQPFTLRLPHVLTPKEKTCQRLSLYLPESQVEWVYDYLTTNHILLKIVPRRTSKLGDYRWAQRGVTISQISLNDDLSPALTLWVLLHEVAHHETHLHHPRAKAHGHEWQSAFRQLIAEHIDAFPSEARPQIDRFLASPTYSTQQAIQIEQLLRSPNPADSPMLTLDQLQPGSRFRLIENPTLLFECIEHRRTRWICADVATGQRYLVRGTAQVAIE